MSVRVMAAVWELDLPKPEKFLALSLADFADDDGGNAYPSVGLLAWKTGDSTRNVRRLLRRLEERGLLVVVHQGGGRRPDGRGWTTVYRLDTTKAAKLSPYTPPKLSTPESTTRTPRRDNPDTTARQPGHPRPPTHQEPSRTISRAAPVEKSVGKSQASITIDLSHPWRLDEEGGTSRHRLVVPAAAITEGRQELRDAVHIINLEGRALLVDGFDEGGATNVVEVLEAEITQQLDGDTVAEYVQLTTNPKGSTA